MADALFIVERLNAPPFNMKLLSHRFADLKGLDLLQKVYDVFMHVMPSPKPVNVLNEAEPSSRLVEYLKALKYKPPADPAAFRYALANADSDTLHAILKWVLSQLPTLQKRAMVGFYLAMPEVPAEFKGLQEIAARTQEIAALQAEFRDVHRELEAARAELPPLEEVRRDVQRRENERASLAARLVGAKEKAGRHPAFAQLAPVCEQLAAEQQRTATLRADLLTERQAKERLDGAAARAAGHAAALRESLAAGGGEAAVARLRAQVAQLRERVHGTLPTEIEAQRARLATLSAVTGAAADADGGVARLQAAEKRLRADIAAARALAAQRDAELRGGGAAAAYARLVQLKEQARKREKRRGEQEAKAARLGGKLAALQPTHLAQRVQREIERRGGAAGAGPVDTSDWEDRYSAMKAALPRFKSRKAEEAALRAEGDVLAATLARVRDDERALAAAARRREAAAGAEGYAEAHARLEQVSEKKNALDGERGARATEVSAVVAEIGARIRGRKGVLAPKVRRLRQLRAALEERRGAHGEARATYMHAIDAQDGMFGDLERRVATLQARVSEAERTYRRVGPLAELCDALTAAGASRGGAAQLLQRMHDAAKAEAAAVRKLRAADAQQRAAEQSAGSDTEDMLEALRALVAAKLRLLEGHADGLAPAAFGSACAPLGNTHYETHAGNVLTLA